MAFAAADVFGQFEAPGGLPGVVMVSSTNNVNNASSASCLPSQMNNNNNATCKPMTDRHQVPGTGLQNQLAYDSNYGPRIDVTGPGPARASSTCPPRIAAARRASRLFSADLTNARQDFSITSNWGLGIPCFIFTGGGFPPEQCYSTIQGTSMSTRHALAVLAIIASNDRQARGNVDRMVRMLKNTARKITGNTTQPLSATDTSPGDFTDVPCPSGYCHLGGPVIPNNQAYGAGLADAERAARRSD